MNRNSVSLVFLCTSLFLAPLTAAAVSIDWVSVGNPGNAPDPLSGLGSVNYSYDIGKYDVTVGQYVEFLNTKDPSGSNQLGLYNTNMSDPTLGGVSYSPGNPTGSKYGVLPGDFGHPITAATFYDAIRFANWLNNGQGNASTETGAYDLGTLGANGVPINGDSITRNPGAQVFIPNADEWYKAAFYNPSMATYFLYTTGSNLPPTSSGPTTLLNSANIAPLGPGIPTDVGAYSGTTSPSGAYDMGGNVYQWTETMITNVGLGTMRELRGGSYLYESGNLLYSSFTQANGSDPELQFGFRVAMVPEPDSALLAVTAFGVLAWYRRRLK